MSLRVTGAVAVRVLVQLRRDPRTLVLIVGVPCLLEALLRELFAGRSLVFQHVGAPLLGLFPFVTMFLVTSITSRSRMMCRSIVPGMSNLLVS